MVQQAVGSIEELDAPTVAQQLRNDEIILIDVRETHEFEQERIKGAFLAPFSMLNVSAFPSIPDKDIVLYCAVGNRSADAVKMLLESGRHTRVVHMAGGLVAWKGHGFSTEN